MCSSLRIIMPFQMLCFHIQLNHFECNVKRIITPFECTVLSIITPFQM